jgi:hypothetical protein
MKVTKCYFLGGLLVAPILLAGAPSSAQPQQVAYPEVKVVLDNPYKSDAAFDKMNGAFLDAVQRKDLAALTALVALTFLWTVNDHPADELDLGRDAVHNFKVAFGLRALGEDVDGGVDGGPYWSMLIAFAEGSFYSANDTGTLVCGRMAAEVADDDAFDQARRKIDAVDEPVEWYFTLAAETPIAKAPGDTGAPIAKVGTIAMPLLSSIHRRSLRHRQRISRCFCRRAAPAGCRSPQCARSKPITSATPVLRLARGRLPASTR